MRVRRSVVYQVPSPDDREDAPTRPGASAGSGEVRGTVSNISPRLGSTPEDWRGLQGIRFVAEGNELSGS
jgi:hypothetical protein